MPTLLQALAFWVLLSGIPPAIAGEKDVTLYKNPQCGCCEGYADYLRENGFTVTVKPTEDLADMSRAQAFRTISKVVIFR